MFACTCIHIGYIINEFASTSRDFCRIVYYIHIYTKTKSSIYNINYLVCFPSSINDLKAGSWRISRTARATSSSAPLRLTASIASGLEESNVGLSRFSIMSSDSELYNVALMPTPLILYSLAVAKKICTTSGFAS